MKIEKLKQKADQAFTLLKYYLKPLKYPRWIAIFVIYMIFWLTFALNFDVIRTLMLMTTSFSIFVLYILNAIYIFMSEGRTTQIFLGKDKDDGKGMHYTFPEVDAWLHGMITTVSFWLPLYKHWYPMWLNITVWAIFIYVRMLRPFAKIHRYTNKDYITTFVNVIRTSQEVFTMK